MKNLNTKAIMEKFLKTMFSITVFAGIVLIIGGAVPCCRRQNRKPKKEKQIYLR